MSQRQFTAGICAVCGQNPTVGAYTLCNGCFSQWRHTDPSHCPVCGDPKTTEKSALCFRCENAYSEAKHPLPACSKGDFRPGMCARCKAAPITRRKVDLCDTCFKYWNRQPTPCCAACGSTQLERRENNPNAFRDLCANCFQQWNAVQPGGQRKTFVTPANTKGLGGVSNGQSPLGSTFTAGSVPPQSSSFGQSSGAPQASMSFSAAGVSPNAWNPPSVSSFENPSGGFGTGSTATATGTNPQPWAPAAGAAQQNWNATGTSSFGTDSTAPGTGAAQQNWNATGTSSFGTGSTATATGTNPQPWTPGTGAAQQDWDATGTSSFTNTSGSFGFGSAAPGTSQQFGNQPGFDPAAGASFGGGEDYDAANDYTF